MDNMRCFLMNLIYWLIVALLCIGVYFEAGIVTSLVVFLTAGAVRLGRMINNSIIRHVAKLQDRVLELERKDALENNLIPKDKD